MKRNDIVLEGTLDNQKILITFGLDGKKYFNVSIIIGLVVFEWEQLSPLHQEQVKKQIESKI